MIMFFKCGYMMKNTHNRSCSVMRFLWFVLCSLSLGGMLGSVYGGIDVLLRDGINSRWWMGLIGFFVFWTLVKKFAEKMKK